MHNFVYLSLYIISLIKIINKNFTNFFFYNSLFINEDGDLNSTVKSFLILAYYRYLHMRKLQQKKKKAGCKGDSMKGPLVNIYKF